MHQTFEKSSLARTHKLDDIIELPKSPPKKTYEEGLECEIVMVKMPREVPSFDESGPQLQTLPSCPPLHVNLGDKKGLEPPIKPHSPDSFRMKVIDPLTIYTPPSPHMASFHPKDMYCYYHPCIDDPKKHYGFKPGLLGHSRSLGVDFSNLEMIGDDRPLESKEVSFLRE
ncbi:hypothetical protein Tco_0980116 [Tanacetum coccineum]